MLYKYLEFGDDVLNFVRPGGSGLDGYCLKDPVKLFLLRLLALLHVHFEHYHVLLYPLLLPRLLLLLADALS